VKKVTVRRDIEAEARGRIEDSIKKDGVAILPPMDVLVSLQFIKLIGLTPNVTMLDPWYNKGFGGVREDYREYILQILAASGDLSDHVFLWGFPEIVAIFVEKLPPSLTLTAWLTWYYKNNPSVIRGWRSSQCACLHLTRPGVKLYPEHFLNEAQKDLQARGKLRYMPGPTSVIESSLLIGFVGRKEQTGHPSQKPAPVFERMYMMSTKEGDLIFDPMAGSGTTGEVAKATGRNAILSDHSEDYIRMIEKRLGVKRIRLLSVEKILSVAVA
jgi:site-specific DNA-methyltransferase (adenine-specific)